MVGLYGEKYFKSNSGSSEGWLGCDTKVFQRKKREACEGVSPRAPVQSVCEVLKVWREGNSGEGTAEKQQCETFDEPD